MTASTRTVSEAATEAAHLGVAASNVADICTDNGTVAYGALRANKLFRPISEFSKVFGTWGIRYGVHFEGVFFPILADKPLL